MPGLQWRTNASLAATARKLAVESKIGLKRLRLGDFRVLRHQAVVRIRLSPLATPGLFCSKSAAAQANDPDPAPAAQPCLKSGRGGNKDARIRGDIFHVLWQPLDTTSQIEWVNAPVRPT